MSGFLKYCIIPVMLVADFLPAAISGDDSDSHTVTIRVVQKNEIKAETAPVISDSISDADFTATDSRDCRTTLTWDSNPLSRKITLSVSTGFPLRIHMEQCREAAPVKAIQDSVRAGSVDLLQTRPGIEGECRLLLETEKKRTDPSAGQVIIYTITAVD